MSEEHTAAVIDPPIKIVVSEATVASEALLSDPAEKTICEACEG